MDNTELVGVKLVIEDMQWTVVVVYIPPGSACTVYLQLFEYLDQS